MNYVDGFKVICRFVVCWEKYKEHIKQQSRIDRSVKFNVFTDEMEIDGNDREYDVTMMNTFTDNPTVSYRAR